MPSAAPASPARVARAAAYRELILDAAEQAFADEGFEATRVQAIVSASGLSLGTVYSLYGGKASIFRAVHERRFESLFAVAARAVAAHDRPTEMLLEGIATFIRWLADHPTYLRMHLAEGYSWAAPSQYRTELQVEAWERGISMMAALFEAGIADGTMRPGAPRLLARLASATQQVFLSAWFEAGMTEPLDALIARVQDHVAHSFFVEPEPEPEETTP